MSPELLDHFRAPRNLGSLPRDDADVGTGEAGRPDEGALVRIQVRVGSGDRVIDTRFKAFGCPATIASGSWATTRLRGKPVAEARRLSHEAIARALRLPPDRWGCAELTSRALRAALEDVKRKAR